MSSEKVKKLNLSDFIGPTSAHKQLQETVSTLAPDDVKTNLGENAVDLLIDGMAEATTIIGPHPNPNPNNEYCWFRFGFSQDLISSWWEKSPVSKDMVEIMALFYADIGYMEIDKKDNLRILNPDLANTIIKIVS